MKDRLLLHLLHLPETDHTPPPIHTLYNIIFFCLSPFAIQTTKGIFTYPAPSNLLSLKILLTLQFTMSTAQETDLEGKLLRRAEISKVNNDWKKSSPCIRK